MLCIFGRRPFTGSCEAGKSLNDLKSGTSIVRISSDCAASTAVKGLITDDTDFEFWCLDRSSGMREREWMSRAHTKPRVPALFFQTMKQLITQLQGYSLSLSSSVHRRCYRLPKRLGIGTSNRLWKQLSVEARKQTWGASAHGKKRKLKEEKEKNKKKKGSISIPTIYLWFHKQCGRL